MVCSLINQKIPDDESSGALSYIKCNQPLLAYHTISSLIQTILSVLESHQISHVLTRVADYTAGGESHPAPKNLYVVYTTISGDLQPLYRDFRYLSAK